MNRVVHFEIHAEDPARAVTFYTKLFGWKIEPWGPPGVYWTVMTGPDSEPGINGGIVPRRGTIDGTAVIAYVCTVKVKSVDETLALALSLGGKLALAKMPIPGMGWLAYFKDTEGNILGVMHDDPAAA
jgi:predicted enzyme related to lactoylglutathione lyase